MAHARAEAEIPVFRPLVDQAVLALRLPQDMEVHLLEVLFLLRIATVVEAALVPGPGDFGEAHALQLVGAVLPRGHLADMEHLPIAAALAESVSQKGAVLAVLRGAEGDRPIRAQRVGVEEDFGLPVQALPL